MVKIEVYMLTSPAGSMPLRSASGLSTHSRKTSLQEPRETSTPMSRQSSKESHQNQHKYSIHHQGLKPLSADSLESSDSEPTKISLRRINPSATRNKPTVARKVSNVDIDAQSDEGDEDDEDSTPFLPFASAGSKSNSKSFQPHDPSATLRGELVSSHQTQRPTAHRRTTSERVTPKPFLVQPQILTSSASSASSGPHTVDAKRDRPTDAQTQNSQARLHGPLSHRQAAALEAAGLSRRRQGHGKEGSDGTPSMGSSFSDLDDASVTQSALEEALLSNMQHNGSGNGSVASRMSGISQALRSRYFEAQSRPGR